MDCPPSSVARDVVVLCKQFCIDFSLHGLRRKLHASLFRKLYLLPVGEQDILAGHFLHDIFSFNPTLTGEDFNLVREIVSPFAAYFTFDVV